MDSFVHAFELDGAARYIDHSAAGGDWTWTAGGRLSPVADVTIRGNFTRSVRAPAITESFSPTSLAFATANDPVSYTHLDVYKRQGHITLSGEWNRARGLTTGDRFLTSAAGPFFTTAADPASPFQQQFYYDQRLNVFTNSGVPLAFDSIPEFGGIFDASGNVLTFNDAGRLVPLDFGTRTGSLFESSGGNGFATKDYGNLATNNDRYLATALGSFELSDTVRWFGEGWYAHSKGTNIAAQPLYNTALAGPGTSPNGNLVLSLDNPYLNDADRATIRDNLAAYGLLGGIPIDADGDGNPDFATAPDSFLMARANTDLTTGRSDTTVELYRFVTGFDGELGVGDRIYLSLIHI